MKGYTYITADSQGRLYWHYSVNHTQPVYVASAILRGKGHPAKARDSVLWSSDINALKAEIAKRIRGSKDPESVADLCRVVAVPGEVPEAEIKSHWVP